MTALYAVAVPALVATVRGIQALIAKGSGRVTDESEWLYDNREREHMKTCQMCNPAAARPCDVCGDASTTADGVVGAYLCDDTVCFHSAWDLAFGDGA